MRCCGRRGLDNLPAGRPSKYNPAYCREIIETMGEGYSLTAFAGVIGVCRDTLNEWQREHPDFSDAVKVAKAKRTLSLEKDLLSADSGSVVTSRIFALKNAAPDEWRDRKDHNLTSDDGSMTPKGIDASKLSAEALREIMNASNAPDA